MRNTSKIPPFIVPALPPSHPKDLRCSLKRKKSRLQEVEKFSKRFANNYQTGHQTNSFDATTGSVV
ncbi:Hypothetical predicted protein, partial [Olea europaea subsp. europaea]